MRNGIFQKKVKIEGILFFETAFHIGTGREGDLATDMGVLKDLNGFPVLPGSTLKGNFRCLAERLAAYLHLKACLLDAQLSGFACVSDELYRKDVLKDFQNQKSEQAKLTWIKSHTCDICQLFGSPFQASRIFFSDGELQEWGGSYQIRDGVCLDRDSETARHRAKYDFEVVSPETQFRFTIDLENPSDIELALVGAVIVEWENGFRLGGFSSRGLGRVKLIEKKIQELNYDDPEQLKGYLLDRTMQSNEALLSQCLNQILKAPGGTDA
jgi:CRISPR-associated protein Csm3